MHNIFMCVYIYITRPHIKRVINNLVTSFILTYISIWIKLFASNWMIQWNEKDFIEKTGKQRQISIENVNSRSTLSIKLAIVILFCLCLLVYHVIFNYPFVFWIYGSYIAIGVITFRDLITIDKQCSTTPSIEYAMY